MSYFFDDFGDMKPALPPDDRMRSAIDELKEFLAAFGKIKLREPITDPRRLLTDGRPRYVVCVDESSGSDYTIIKVTKGRSRPHREVQWKATTLSVTDAVDKKFTEFYLGERPTQDRKAIEPTDIYMPSRSETCTHASQSYRAGRWICARCEKRMGDR